MKESTRCRYLPLFFFSDTNNYRHLLPTSLSFVFFCSVFLVVSSETIYKASLHPLSLPPLSLSSNFVSDLDLYCTVHRVTLQNGAVLVPALGERHMHQSPRVINRTAALALTHP